MTDTALIEDPSAKRDEVKETIDRIDTELAELRANRKATNARIKELTTQREIHSRVLGAYNRALKWGAQLSIAVPPNNTNGDEHAP